jgi:hypothetical protein
MRTRLLAALSTLLICGAASAQTTLPSIEVRAGTSESVMVSCTKPDTVTREDVARVLSVEQSSMTRALQNRFVAAVSEACKAGIAHIQVKADANGTLTWKRMD